MAEPDFRDDFSAPSLAQEDSGRGPSPMAKRVALFLLFSLIIHAILVLIIFPLWQRALDRSTARFKEIPKEQVVEINLLPQKKDLTIVDIPPPQKEAVPPDAKAAALYNQTVKEEQVARTPPGKNGNNGKSPPLEKNSPVSPPLEKGGRRDLTSPQPSQKSSNPSTSIQSRFGAPGESEEFLPDYKVGNHTYVNALRYPHIGYFVQLKRKFTTAFNPRSALMNHRSELAGGKIAVVLGVTVDSSGNLKDLMIIRRSAIDDYDQSALRTVSQSAPFTSPPGNLLDQDKLLRMSWTFTVYF